MEEEGIMHVQSGSTKTETHVKTYYIYSDTLANEGNSFRNHIR